MVIGEANGRTILDDLAKITTKLQPSRKVAMVVVDLITGEKENIGINLFNVIDDILPGNVTSVAGMNRVSSECRHHQFLLVDRVFSDCPLVIRLVAVNHPIGHRFGIVPILHAEGSGPPLLNDVRRSDFLPLPFLHDLEASGHWSLFPKGIELCRELQCSVAHGVEREANGILLLNFRNVQYGATPPLFGILLRDGDAAKNQTNDKDGKPFGKFHDEITGF